MSKSPKNISTYVNVIIKQLPTDLLALWFAVEDAHELFKIGVLPFISKKDVTKSFKCSRNDIFVHKNRIYNLRCFCFGY